MYTRLKHRTESIKEEVVCFAQQLVQTPSLSLNEDKVAALVEEKMRQLGYDDVVRDECGNVIGILHARKADRTLLLNSHMDTVPAGDASRWNESPHSGRIEDGRLYGLGASDCKAGLAAQIYAGAILKRSLLPLEGNLVVAATVAEENGRSVGVRELIERTLPELGLSPDYAILGEATELGLYYGHDGWGEFDIVVEGPNAFHVDDATRAILHDLDAGAPGHRDAGQDGAWAVRPPRFENVSGHRRAIIPLERRLHAAEEPDNVVEQIQHNVGLVAQAAGSVAVQVMVRQEEQKLYTGRTTVVRHITHAWSTDPFHPLMERSRQALAAAGCHVRPGRWKLDRIGMGTAGSTLVTQYNIPTLGYGPGLEAMTHAANECAELDKIHEAVYGTASIVHGLIGMPVFGWTSDEI